MNRQLRRAQEKSEKKRDRETEKKRDAKRSARQRRRSQTKEPPTSTPSPNGASSGQQAKVAQSAPSGRTGRFAGILALATAVLIFIGAFDQRQTLETVNYVVDAAFFLFLGYFTTLWLLRKNMTNAFAVTLVGGIAVAAAVQLIRYFTAEVAAQPLMVLLALPGLVAGSWIARAVHRKTA